MDQLCQTRRDGETVTFKMPAPEGDVEVSADKGFVTVVQTDDDGIWDAAIVCLRLDRAERVAQEILKLVAASRAAQASS